MPSLRQSLEEFLPELMPRLTLRNVKEPGILHTHPQPPAFPRDLLRSRGSLSALRTLGPGL